MRRSLAEWLTWQQSLHPRDIELGLSRVRTVFQRLELAPPSGRVFTIAGTNGKGTTAHYLGALLAAASWRAGVYTSPHLVRYNERIQVAGACVADADLVAAFERVDEARQGTSLTYFEFGTLAAFCVFDACALDAWILEVGLGGRLDAVNVVDADFSLITTIALDHEDWLGHSLDDIAREKAGILRPGRPGFVGADLPPAIQEQAANIGAELRVAGEDFGHARGSQGWDWWSASGLRFADLPLPDPGHESQLANISLAMAAVAHCEPDLLHHDTLRAALTGAPPPGRCQRLRRKDREWVLDVAHNPQAAASLAASLAGQKAPAATTIVIGMHANKDVDGLAAALRPLASHWIACRAGEGAGLDPAALAGRLGQLVDGEVDWRDRPADALQLALDRSQSQDRILVCGSFEVVGPAMQWLGWMPGG